MKKTSFLLTALAMAMMSSPLHAAVVAPTSVDALINIRFVPNLPVAAAYNYTGGVSYGGGTSYVGGASSGAVTVGGVGNSWNNVDVNATGPTVLTPVAGFPPGSLTFSAEALGTILQDKSGFYGTDYAKLMNTYVYSYGTAESISIGGLEGNKNYDVYVLTQGTKKESGMKLQLTGLNSAGATQIFVQNGVTSGANGTFIAGENYMLQTLQTNGSGQLNFLYASNLTNKKGIINGMQITASSTPVNPPTPEPASMLLIGVGGALISAAKLRKKKKIADNTVA